MGVFLYVSIERTGTEMADEWNAPAWADSVHLLCSKQTANEWQCMVYEQQMHGKMNDKLQMNDKRQMNGKW